MDTTALATTYDETLLVGETEYLRPFAQRIHVQRVKGVEAAIEIGKALRDAKDKCARGHWLIFLDVVGFESRTAQRAMRAAKIAAEHPERLADTNTLRGLLATASQTLTGSDSGKPKVIDVTPEPAATETETETQPAATEPAATEQADTVTHCRHCGAPAGWLGLVRTQDWGALTELAEAAEAAAEAAEAA